MHPLPLTRAYRNRPKNLQERFWKNRKKPPETAKQRPDEEIPLGGDHYQEKPPSYSKLKINSPQKANFQAWTAL